MKGRRDPLPGYKCFPPAGRKNGGRNNRDGAAVKFRLIEDAATWLRMTSGGGIRVAQNGTSAGQGSATLNRDLGIEHDDGRQEFP